MLQYPDMVYANLGRQGNVYIGKVDCEKQYMQKRFLIWTLRDTLVLIRGQQKKPQEKSGEELAFSQSYHFVKRKKQIVFQRIIPYTLCLCEIYENSALIARIR